MVLVDEMWVGMMIDLQNLFVGLGFMIDVIMGNMMYEFGMY